MARKAGPGIGAEVPPDHVEETAPGSALPEPMDAADGSREELAEPVPSTAPVEPFAPEVSPPEHAAPTDRAAPQSGGGATAFTGAPPGPTTDPDRPFEGHESGATDENPGPPASLLDIELGRGQEPAPSDGRPDPEATSDPWRPAPHPTGRPEGWDRLDAAGDSAPPAAIPGTSAADAGAGSPPAPRSRSGFGGLLLGGLIAAALGFGAAWLAQERFGLFATRLPPDLEERLAAIEARPSSDPGAVDALSDRLADAETRLSTLEDAPTPEEGATASVDLAPIRAEFSEVLAAAQERVASFEERLADLESRPVPEPAPEGPPADGAPLGSLAAPDPGPAVAPAALARADASAIRAEVLAEIAPRLERLEAGLGALDASLSGLTDGVAALDTRLGRNEAAVTDLSDRLGQAEAASRAATEEARAAAEALAEAQSRAAAAETEIRAGDAVAALDRALDTGAPFVEELGALEALGIAAPEPLARAAADGLPSLVALREAFPEAARAALSAARDQGLVEEGGGVMGFLRGQLGVRSVSPREVDDPDAVLSRAGRQLDQGNLDAALAEITTLPDPAQAAMSGWIAQARSRAEAEAALATLRSANPASPQDASPAD